MTFNDDYWDRPDCVCEDCGKKFKKGDEGDNERFCLRCEHSSLVQREIDWGDHD